MDFINELKREKASLQKRLNAIEVLLESYGTADVHTTIEADIDDAFPSNESYIKQIAYTIKKENRFLHNSEITNVLKNYSDKEKGKLSIRISVVLSRAKAVGGNLTNITIGDSRRNTFWGSKEWLDDDGNVKPNHMYDKKLLVTKKSKEINI